MIETWRNKWSSLSESQKQAVLFRIRADLFIDEIPLTLGDLEHIENMSALELLEALLHINDWDTLIDSALEEDKDLAKLANTIKIRVTVEKDLFTCTACKFEGRKEDFFVIEETDELICPECEAEGELIIKSQKV